MGEVPAPPLIEGFEMGFRDALYNSRTQREQRRSERKQERAMKSPVFQYASELYVDEPYEWGQEEFEQVIEDANAEIRKRRIAHVTGVLMVLVVAASGFYAGWTLKPPTPDPHVQWDCNVTIHGAGVPEEVNCKGVQ